MDYIIVKLTLASICFVFNGIYTCHSALVGLDTPLGIYTITHYITDPPDLKYGGDILVFKEDNNDVWAIHRVLDIPGQQRIRRLKSGNVYERRNITLGCINVEPEVYQELVECCSNSTLYIVP